MSLEKIDEIHVNLLLTRRCNYSCFHCMYASGPTMPSDQMRWEDLQEIEGFLRELAKHLKTDTNFTVNLVGGEPTLDMEHFGRTLEIVSEWEFERESWNVCPSLEMTTNGWWLENAESCAAFGNIVRKYWDDERLRVRISDSPYHQKFRSQSLARLFERNRAAVEKARNSYGSSNNGHGPILGHLEELNYDLYGECDEEGNYSMDWATERKLSGIAGVQEGIEKYLLYVEWQGQGEEKISPVGRAKVNGIGWQDGACHATSDVKFTFMPTKEGERPGRLYDPCCNGGRVPLGFADEGLGLLLKRIAFMEALHKKYPSPETSWNNMNPLQGERCRQCPSFGAKWLRENKEKIEKKISKELARVKAKAIA
jgi:hypothetical protein